MWMLAFIIGLLPWIVEADLLLRGQVGSVPDAGERANAIIYRGEPVAGEQARPHIIHATQTAARIADAYKGRPLPGGEPFVLGFWEVNLPESSTPPDVRRAAIELELQALGEFEREGVFDAVLEAGACPRDVVWGFSDVRLKSEEPRPRLKDVRLISRALQAAQAQAGARGDWDRYVRSVEASFMLARLTARSGTLFHRIVAAAQYTYPLEHLAADVGAGRLPPTRAARIAAAMDANAFTPPDRTLDLLAVDLELTAATLFTDGPLGGRPIISEYSSTYEFVIAIRGLLGDSAAEWFHSLPETTAFNLAALVLASREETSVALQELERSFRASAALDRPARRLAERAGPPSGIRHAFTRELADMSFSAYEKWLEEEEESRLKLDGTRLLLALELYKADHASYPDTLAALAPRYIGRIPQDAVSGHPIQYRKLDPAADPLARPYVLYSFGVDAEDNGGVYSVESNINALLGPVTAEGHDYVFSVPPNRSK